MLAALKVPHKVSKWASLTTHSDSEATKSHFKMDCIFNAQASPVSQDMLSLVYVTRQCSLRHAFQQESWNNFEKRIHLLFESVADFYNIIPFQSS